MDILIQNVCVAGVARSGHVPKKNLSRGNRIECRYTRNTPVRNTNMKKIIMGKLLSGSPAEIKATSEEVQAFDRAESYQARLLILRRAAFRMRMVSMLLTADGHLVSNLNCVEPGPGEETVWLKAGEFGEVLDRSLADNLGPRLSGCDLFGEEAPDR